MLKDVKKVAENPAVNAAIGVETNDALKKATREVSELEPSLEGAASPGGPTVNVWGSNATQYNGDTKLH